jgi:hypothetical protein
MSGVPEGRTAPFRGANGPRPALARQTRWIASGRWRFRTEPARVDFGLFGPCSVAWRLHRHPVQNEATSPSSCAARSRLEGEDHPSLSGPGSNTVRGGGLAVGSSSSARRRCMTFSLIRGDRRHALDVAERACLEGREVAVKRLLGLPEFGLDPPPAALAAWAPRARPTASVPRSPARSGLSPQGFDQGADDALRAEPD